MHVEQYLREEGPKSHEHKAKTPTAGGVCFMVAAVVTSIAWLVYTKSFDWSVAIVIGWGLACGLLGLVDDLAKVKQKTNKGVSARMRLIVETLLGCALGAAIYFVGTPLYGHGAIILPGGISLSGIHLPGIYLGNLNQGDLNLAGLSSAAVSSGAINIVPPAQVHVTLIKLSLLLWVPLAAFLTAATTNAVNLHDGMDGLAAGTGAQVFATLALIFLATGQLSFAVLSAAMAGGVLGFLLWNRYPAAIFMGDTGSLFLGAMMAALVVSGGVVFWFVPLSLIYIVEALSVMAQVSYYKLTKPYTPEKPISSLALAWYKLTHKLPGEGKRIFRMAPLHHHFEAALAEQGITEWQVVAGFWLVQLGLSLAVLALFYLWR